MKRFLITTADERTWPKDVPVLFLGEWCKLYNRRHVWEAMDAEVVPYHWDDREKLYRDYIYLKQLHEELLQELSERLNEIHGVNHALRYWRIFVGPWLGNFVQVLFDRWEMIQRVISDYSVAGALILDIAQMQVVLNDMAHFNRLYVEDAWNEVIYGQLLQGWTNVPVEKMQHDTQNTFQYVQQAQTSDSGLKNKLVRLTSSFSQKLVRKNDAFFIGTYIPLRQDYCLQWRLGQVPINWQSIQPPKVQVDWTQRMWNEGEPELEGFPGFVRAMIPLHIPTIYVEGYSALQAFCDALPWPAKPRLIFTSTSYYADDVFKSWAAKKVETGAPLVIGQHGGFFGIGRWDFTEDHQCYISDGWLSWGWDDEKRPKIKPVSNLKMIGCNMERDASGYALMVETTIPRQSYHMYCVPVAGQWLDYFNDQCRFIEALPDKIRRCLLVRLYVNDYGWCQAARWKDCFPDVNLDDGVAPIMPLIKKSRICISTYNATSFLESLAMNIPTIMFWNPNHWELRDSAVPYFETLKRVGIFHETPESAAAKMSEVWEDIAVWWNSEPVQSVRKDFCHRYSRISERPLEDMEHVLRLISDTTTN